jgi:hypothetical protein
LASDIQVKWYCDTVPGLRARASSIITGPFVKWMPPIQQFRKIYGLHGRKLYSLFVVKGSTVQAKLARIMASSACARELALPLLPQADFELE